MYVIVHLSDSPDEEDKEQASGEGLDDRSEDPGNDLDEPLSNERFYLDNGEGTCEIKE